MGVKKNHRASCSLGLAVLAAVAAALTPGRAGADRKYFLESYTPYLAPAGETELETWLTAKSGKQDPHEHTAWEPRIEYESGITDRLTGAAYLNFSQASGESLHFDTPSLEFIYRLATPGSLPLDPAAYLEASENGEEMELEPKVLLARRLGRTITALNLVGEFEYRHNDEELLADGSVLHKEFTGEICAGFACELQPRIAVALETRYRAEYPNFGRRADSVFSLGPSLNLQSEKTQFALGVLPQISGTPKTSGSRNLVDFEKTQVRAVVGIAL